MIEKWSHCCLSVFLVNRNDYLEFDYFSIFLMHLFGFMLWIARGFSRIFNNRGKWENIFLRAHALLTSMTCYYEKNIMWWIKTWRRFNWNLHKHRYLLPLSLLLSFVNNLFALLWTLFVRFMLPKAVKLL